MDGDEPTRNHLRSYKGEQGSYANIIVRVRSLLQQQKHMQVSVRVTVIPSNLSLRDSIDSLIALGFHSIGVSPWLRSPSGHGEMTPTDLDEVWS